eukprot:5934805-Pleurochrysis_carterae.AAC.5
MWSRGDVRGRFILRFPDEWIPRHSRDAVNQRIEPASTVGFRRSGRRRWRASEHPALREPSRRPDRCRVSSVPSGARWGDSSR